VVSTQSTTRYIRQFFFFFFLLGASPMMELECTESPTLQKTFVSVEVMMRAMAGR
jgi:hypothetical protein